MFQVLPRLIFHNKTVDTEFEILRVPTKDLPQRLLDAEIEREDQLLAENPHLSRQHVTVREPKIFTLEPRQLDKFGAEIPGSGTIQPSQDLGAIRFRIQGMQKWSALVVLGDDQAGDFPFVLESGVVGTVEICPERGMLSVNFLVGSSYYAENHCKDFYMVLNKRIKAPP
ncbi:unnamed protein product, partial [Amoebophrya sp. A25]|eukprot:GSA25T00004546001.1